MEGLSPTDRRERLGTWIDECSSIGHATLCSEGGRYHVESR